MTKQNILPTKGVIVLLDILGTKNKWRKEEANDFLNTLDEIINNFDQLENFGNILKDLKKVKYGVNNKTFQFDDNNNSFPNLEILVTNFSDTIIVALYGDVETDAFLIYLMGYFLIPLFRKAFMKEIFLRGVLSIGDFYILNKKDKVVLVGPAINDAAQVYDHDNWIGITTSPSASLTLEQDNKINLFNKSGVSIREGDSKLDISQIFKYILKSFIEYPIPKKNGNIIKGWALAWPRFFHDDDQYYKQEVFEEKLNEKLSFSTYQKNFFEYSIFLKFKNTMEFFSTMSKDALDMAELMS
jgi:hypothetical protein